MSLRAQATRGVRRAFTDNVGIKIVALITAIALFSLVRGAEDAQRPVFVDVVPLLPPPSSNKILVSDIPDQVRLTLRGSRSLLNSLRREDLEVQVDLRDTRKEYYYFDPNAFDIPAGLQVVQVAPATIPLTWAAKVERRLPIVARFAGTPGRHLAVRLSSVEVEPSTVLVRGPENEVSSRTNVETGPIVLNDLGRGRHERRVPLERPPPHATYVDEIAVRVAFEIVPETSERVLHEVEVSIVGGNVRAQVRPDRVDVVVQGPPDAVQAVDPRRVIPFVSVESLAPAGGAVSIPVQVRGVPEGVEVLRVDPAEVFVQPLGRGRPAPAPAPAPR